MKRHYVLSLVALASSLLIGVQPALAGKKPPEPTATHELVSLGEGGFLLNNNGVVMAIVAGEVYAIVPADADGDGAPDTWYVDDNEDGINDLYHLVSPQTGPVTWVQMPGINDWGTVVGSIQFAGQSGSVPCYLEPVDTDADGAADLWYQDGDADGINDLITTLSGPGTEYSAIAYDINNNGVITGSANYTGDAVVWFDGTMQKLGYVGYGAAINDYGVVAGNSSGLVFFVQPLDTDGNGEPDTWFVDDGNGTNALARETSGTWPFGIQSFDINDSGLAVGEGGDGEAYMWQLDGNGNITTTILDPCPYNGRGSTSVSTKPIFINSSGLIAGYAYISYTGKQGLHHYTKSFVVENGATIRIEDRLSNPELLSDGWTQVIGLNDAGIIVLYDLNGYFLTVPIATP